MTVMPPKFISNIILIVPTLLLLLNGIELYIC